MRPACPHPFNSIWEAQFNALAPPFVVPSCQTKPVPRKAATGKNMVTVARDTCCLGQILLTSLGLTSGWRNFYNHPKHDRSQRSTTSFNAYFAGPGWKWPGSTSLESTSAIHCTRISDLASAFHEGCQTAKFIKLRKAATSCMSSSQWLPLGWKTQNISAAKHWGRLALWNFNIIYCTPRYMKLFFLAAVSAGFQAGELREIHELGWAQRLWNGAKTWGKWELSRRAATTSTSVSDQRGELFHLGAKTWARIPVNSSNIEANREQIIPTYSFTFADFCDIQDLTFQNLQLLSYISLVCATKSLKRSYVFGFGVFHSKNPCAQICPNDAQRKL